MLNCQVLHPTDLYYTHSWNTLHAPTPIVITVGHLKTFCGDGGRAGKIVPTDQGRREQISWEFFHGPKLKGTNNHCHTGCALLVRFVSKWTSGRKDTKDAAFCTKCICWKEQTIYWAAHSLTRFMASSVGWWSHSYPNHPPSALPIHGSGPSLFCQRSWFPEQHRKQLFSILEGKHT